LIHPHQDVALAAGGAAIAMDNDHATSRINSYAANVRCSSRGFHSALQGCQHRIPDLGRVLHKPPGFWAFNPDLLFSDAKLLAPRVYHAGSNLPGPNVDGCKAGCFTLGHLCLILGALWLRLLLADAAMTLSATQSFELEDARPA
jgi:hypothetical protein